MMLDLTPTQWRDIKLSLLGAVISSKTCSKLTIDENALIQRYLKTHDQICEAEEVNK